MEKILQQILEKVNSLDEGQSAILARMDNLEEGQNAILVRLDNLEEGQHKLEAKQDIMQLEINELHRKVTVVFEQTAQLTEFKMEILQFKSNTVKTLRRHETDIEFLKKVYIR
ncbi:MAG: hypothetical protein KGZ41_03200 [Dethiobacter sp.]|nr:hypothetical protein [Dethiobacter sp.]MBS3982784.1 hypothetical protein [Dethiobacter sp.]